MSKSKKKKQKKKDFHLLSEIDRSLLTQHEDIIADIELYQYQLYLADKKAKKKNKKKKGNDFYDMSHSVKARKKVVKDMEKKDYFTQFNKILGDIGPVVSIMARLIGALMLAILSVENVRKAIKPETITTMDRIFQVCMSL